MWRAGRWLGSDGESRSGSFGDAIHDIMMPATRTRDLLRAFFAALTKTPHGCSVCQSCSTRQEILNSPSRFPVFYVYNDALHTTLAYPQGYQAGAIQPDMNVLLSEISPTLGHKPRYVSLYQISIA